MELGAAARGCGLRRSAGPGGRLGAALRWAAARPAPPQAAARRVASAARSSRPGLARPLRRRTARGDGSPPGRKLRGRPQPRLALPLWPRRKRAPTAGSPAPARRAARSFRGWCFRAGARAWGGGREAGPEVAGAVARQRGGNGGRRRLRAGPGSGASPSVSDGSRGACPCGKNGAGRAPAPRPDTGPAPAVSAGGADGGRPRGSRLEAQGWGSPLPPRGGFSAAPQPVTAAIWVPPRLPNARPQSHRTARRTPSPGPNQSRFCFFTPHQIYQKKTHTSAPVTLENVALCEYSSP